MTGLRGRILERRLAVGHSISKVLGEKRRGGKRKIEKRNKKLLKDASKYAAYVAKKVAEERKFGVST